MTLHEKLLQTYCGYEGGIPYWDEQADAANITESEIWNWIGGDGNSSDSQIVTDGPFAYLELHLGGVASNTVVPKTVTYHLNRTISESIFQGANQTNVDDCFALDNYDEAWYCYAKKPHSSAHAGTGGTVRPYDPPPPSAGEVTISVKLTFSIQYRCRIPSYLQAIPCSSCTMFP